MNNYELLYILPSNMTGEEIKSTFEDIEKEIIKLGVKKLETLLDHPFLSKTEISKEEESEELKNIPVVKRKLAYSIKKNRFGFYCLFNFSSEGNTLEGINKYLKMNKNILRYFILQSDPMSKAQLAQLQKLFIRKKAEQDKEKKKEKANTTEKVKEERKISKIEKKEKVKTKEIKKKEEKNNEKEKDNDKNKKKIENKEKGEETTQKKKIKLADLEDKLDEILKDSMI